MKTGNNMKLERQSILGNTVTGYKVVDAPAIPVAPGQSNFSETVPNTPPDDIASILLERLENESIKVGARNGSGNR
jgi:hypothetical protein